VKPWFTYLLAIILGLVIGTITVPQIAGFVVAKQTIENGPWQTFDKIGATDADMYVRFVISVRGLFGLAKKETIYFNAETDSDGLSLTSNCTYNLTGGPMATRWWSITAYGPDHYLIPNPEKSYAISENNLDIDDAGRFTVMLSRQQSGGNWLATGAPNDGEQAFALTLRLYNPTAEIYSNMTGVDLPQIKREHCA